MFHLQLATPGRSPGGRQQPARRGGGGLPEVGGHGGQLLVTSLGPTWSRADLLHLAQHLLDLPPGRLTRDSLQKKIQWGSGT
jgi:hypothetical protein